jgi:hypothetical protein
MKPKQPKRVPPHLLTGADLDAYLDAQWRPSPAFVGPVMPPMIAWMLRGAPLWPCGPYPGTINYPKLGEQLTLFTDDAQQGRGGSV